MTVVLNKSDSRLEAAHNSVQSRSVGGPNNLGSEAICKTDFVAKVSWNTGNAWSRYFICDI